MLVEQEYVYHSRAHMSTPDLQYMSWNGAETNLSRQMLFTKQNFEDVE
jgi:hypothetical protein